MNKTNTASNLFTTRIAIQNIDETSIQKAKELFENFQKDGVIFSGTFESNEWGYSDQYLRLHIRFNVDPFLYKRYYEKMLGINLTTFVSYLKAYVMFCMGTYGLECIRSIVNDVKRLTKNDFRELYAADEILTIYHPNHMIDFFTMLPEAKNQEEFDYLMELLDNILDFVRANSFADQARDLASFDSYFLFNDILNDYWKMDLPAEERLFYYPLYLWWKVTGVIPLRPREFILTQRNCLHKKEDGYYLTLRRNHLKGSNRRKNYKVKDDYVPVQYKIPDSLAQEILIYLDYTKDYTATELDTLLSRTRITTTGTNGNDMTAGSSPMRT